MLGQERAKPIASSNRTFMELKLAIDPTVGAALVRF